MSDTAVCKVCGDRHLVEEWRGVKFYECPDTHRFYLLSEVKNVGDTGMGNRGSAG